MPSELLERKGLLCADENVALPNSALPLCASGVGVLAASDQMSSQGKNLDRFWMPQLSLLIDNGQRVLTRWAHLSHTHGVLSCTALVKRELPPRMRFTAVADC